MSDSALTINLPKFKELCKNSEISLLTKDDFAEYYILNGLYDREFFNIIRSSDPVALSSPNGNTGWEWWTNLSNDSRTVVSFGVFVYNYPTKSIFTINDYGHHLNLGGPIMINHLEVRDLLRISDDPHPFVDYVITSVCNAIHAAIDRLFYIQYADGNYGWSMIKKLLRRNSVKNTDEFKDILVVPLEDVPSRRSVYICRLLKPENLSPSIVATIKDFDLVHREQLRRMTMTNQEVSIPPYLEGSYQESGTALAMCGLAERLLDRGTFELEEKS